MFNEKTSKPITRGSKTALCILAKNAGMRHVRDDVFSYDGETYVPSPIGWQKNLCHNYKMLYDGLARQYNELKIMYDSQRNENHSLKESLKEINGKTVLKVRKILEGRVTDKEMVRELKRYLNVKGR